MIVYVSAAVLMHGRLNLAGLVAGLVLLAVRFGSRVVASALRSALPAESRVGGDSSQPLARRRRSHKRVWQWGAR